VDETAFDHHIDQLHTVQFIEEVQPLIDHELDTTRANLIERTNPQNVSDEHTKIFSTISHQG
jgi:hypothetical protein